MIEIDQILGLGPKLRLHLLGNPDRPIPPTPWILVWLPPPASRAQTASRSPASSTLPRVAPKMGVGETSGATYQVVGDSGYEIKFNESLLPNFSATTPRTQKITSNLNARLGLSGGPGIADDTLSN